MDHVDQAIPGEHVYVCDNVHAYYSSGQKYRSSKDLISVVLLNGWKEMVNLPHQEAKIKEQGPRAKSLKRNLKVRS